MEEDKQQFDQDDFTEEGGQNGVNDDQQINTEQSVEDGGDQAMETGGDQGEEDDSEDDRKIFVGGLSWETTTKDLREYFEKFGEVSNCTLKTDLETRQSRGFGFVVFKTADTLQKVIDCKDHKLHGRTIDPKLANPREGIKKIFVGRLDPGVSEDDVKTYFSQFGPVAKMDFPFDKTKEQRRAFCFVEFEKDKAVKKVLNQTTHKLGGQEVDVKKATPSNFQAGGAPGGRGGRGGRGWNGGPSSGGRGGRGGRGGGNWNQGSGGYGGGYGGYGQSGYGGYGQSGYGYGQSGYGGYGYGQDYYGYGQGGWGGYDQGGYGGYGGYDGYDYGGWGYGQEEGSGYGKTQKRGGHSGGYHPYNR